MITIRILLNHFFYFRGIDFIRNLSHDLLEYVPNWFLKLEI